MATFAVSRALGLLRDIAISARFGTSGEYDVYVAVIRIPDILFVLMAGGALASAFIPTFAGYFARDDEDGAWRLASHILNLVFVALAAASAVAAVFAEPIITGVLAPGFSAAQVAVAVPLLRILLIAPAIFGVSGVIMGILNARQRFLLPALAPVLYNLGIIEPE